MLDDLRHAARSLIRSPGFTVAALVILGLGVAAVSAMFDLVDAYVLRPPAGVADPGRLVVVRPALGGRPVGEMTYLDYADLRSSSRTFSGLMAYRRIQVDWGRGDATRRVPAALVSGDYFAVLGAGAALGRTLLPDEERPALAHPVAVISDHLWRTALGSDRDVVGRTVAINGRSFTVVGVAPRGFRGHSPDQAFDVWIPLGMCRVAAPEALASVDDRVFRWLTVVGRLAPGASLAQARAEATLAARRLARAGAGGGEPYALTVEPARPALRGDTFAQLLIGGVSVLFLVVCANLSSLVLARNAGRRREIAIRLALGAPRGRLVRRLVTETVVLGVAAGGLGLVAAPSLAAAALAWSGGGAGVPDIAGTADLGASTALAGFSAATALLAGIALGLGPALRVTGQDPQRSLREGTGGRSPGRSRTRGALVIAQLALSLALLSAGGLFLSTLRNYRALVRVPEPRRMLLASVQPSHQGYDVDRQQEYFRQLLERMRRLPGVAAATVVREASLTDTSFFTMPVSGEGADAVAAEPAADAGYAVVAPGFFPTVGVALARGRDFDPRDGGGSRPVVIVNATLARRLWPGADPLGRTLWLSGERAGREVVGVAPDRPTRYGPLPFLYYPLTQSYPWPGSVHVLVVRTAGEATSLLPAVRREAAALDPGLPLFNPRTLENEIAGQRFFERLAGVVMGTSGIVALLLAVVGVYGVVSNWVGQRLHEVGVRMALGADAGHVLGVVMRRAAALALAGVALGVAGALVLDRLCAAWLYGALAAEPVVLGAAALLLVVTALAASLVPARRATKVDPLVVLRAE